MAATLQWRICSVVWAWHISCREKKVERRYMYLGMRICYSRLGFDGENLIITKCTFVSSSFKKTYMCITISI